MALFKFRGVHCVVDGQFGSTGKGALSAYLAEKSLAGIDAMHFDGAIYSGGPNSGHTAYLDDRRIVLKQLPMFSVYSALRGRIVPAYLSAGAIIDRDILKQEAEEHYKVPIFVHPNAAILTDEDKLAEREGFIARVAGTRSGTGAALARKINRDPNVIANKSLGQMPRNVVIQDHRMKVERNSYFMEVSQGFSLGINSHFYPKVTSRECTVMQGLADARVAPRNLARTFMAIRTFPIRVGDVDGHSSGNWYSDQHETSWENIGVKPELTTVTKRIRRVASFSIDQFYDACRANDPDIIFVSHMDYLSEDGRMGLMEDLYDARANMNKRFTFLLGFGPNVSDIREEEKVHARSHNSAGNT